LLRLRCFAFRAAFGLLLNWLFPLCAVRESLRVRHLTLRDGLRIAPYAITSRPRAVHGFLRAQHFKLRTGHRLLCVRRLALSSKRGLLRSLHFAPRAASGLLRRQHLEFCTEFVVLRIRHLSLRPVHRLLCVRHLALSLGLRISPPAYTYRSCVNCELLRTQHLVLRSGTLGST